MQARRLPETDVLRPLQQESTASSSARAGAGSGNQAVAAALSSGAWLRARTALALHRLEPGGAAGVVQAGAGALPEADLGGDEMVPTGAVVQEGDLVRAAAPADGGAAEREVGGTRWRYVATSGDLYGWVEADGVEEVDAGAVGLDAPELAVAGGGGEGMASLTPEEQQRLLEVLQAVPFYVEGTGRAAPEGEDLAEGFVHVRDLDPMEVVVDEGRTTEAPDLGELRQVRTLGDRRVGWVPTKGLAARAVDSSPVVADGVWVGGYVLVSTAAAQFEPGMDTHEERAPDGTTVEVTEWDAPAQGGLYYDWWKAGWPVEVLHVGGAPFAVTAGDATYWLARSQAGSLPEQQAIDASTFASLAERYGEEYTAFLRERQNVGDEVAWVESGQVRVGADGLTEGSSVRDEIAALNPDGISVAFVTRYVADGDQFGTFLTEAATWAQANGAVAIQGGALVTGMVNIIEGKHEILDVLNRIQLALRQGSEELSDSLRVRHIALFAHGSTSQGSWWGGLATGDEGWTDADTLRETDLAGLARSLGAFVSSDVSVALFACSTGRVYGESGTWDIPQEGEVSGEGAFADRFADALVAVGATDAMVMGHTTAGPTVRNPYARLFEGGDEGGAVVFAWVFDPLEEWLGDVLDRMGEVSFGERTAEQVVREELFSWFRDEVMASTNTPFAADMGVDPEAFRVEARLRARAWVEARLASWGVVQAGQSASLRLSYAVYPFRWTGSGFEGVAPRIPAEAELRVASDGEAAARWHSQWGHDVWICVETDAWEGEGPIWLPADWLELGSGARDVATAAPPGAE